jgi:histidyl-tRNA synthetase
MKLQLAKGVSDTAPEDMISLQRTMDNLRDTFERYGFVPLDTPVIERFDILSAKYAGGAEILKETFKLTDQGGRELGLRYDLTVPFARFVGMNPMLKLPFKRYQMAKVWRDGPIGLGRFREFWQCDVDIMGSKKMCADAEILELASNVFSDLNLDILINLNNRKLLNGLLDFLGIKDNKGDIILVIDKLLKVSKKEFFDELKTKDVDEVTANKLLDLLSFEGDNNQKLDYLKKIVVSDEGREGLFELEELFDYLEVYGIKNYVLNLSLSRGLNIYTGTIFEITLVDSEIKSTVAAGGRYDMVISQFLNSKNDYPCVGISFGLSRINAASSKKEAGSLTDVFVVPVGDDKLVLGVVKELRASGLKVETDIMGRNLNKNLNYANSKKIPFVVFVGADELGSGSFKLKNMVSGEEFSLSVPDISLKIKEILSL